MGSGRSSFTGAAAFCYWENNFQFPLDTFVIQDYTLTVAKKQEQPRLRAWRPTIEDAKLMQELQQKLGVNEPALLRMGLRKLAEAEGLR